MKFNNHVNIIEEGSKSDLLILKINRTYQPNLRNFFFFSFSSFFFSSKILKSIALSLLLKGNSQLVQGVLKKGKLIYSKDELLNKISPSVSMKVTSEGCEFDSVEEAVADFGKSFLKNLKIYIERFNF